MNKDSFRDYLWHNFLLSLGSTEILFYKKYWIVRVPLQNFGCQLSPADALRYVFFLQYDRQRSSNRLAGYSGTLSHDLGHLPLHIWLHSDWSTEKAVIISIHWDYINSTPNILARCTEIPLFQRYRYDVPDTPVAAKAVWRARAVVNRVVHGTTHARSFLGCHTRFRNNQEPRSHTPPSNSALAIWRARHPCVRWSTNLGAWRRFRGREWRDWRRAP